MSFEKNPKKEESAIDLVRQKVRVLLKVEVDPLEDKEFQGFLGRHFITESDVKGIIEEEKNKLKEEKEATAKEYQIIKKHRRE